MTPYKKIQNVQGEIKALEFQLDKLYEYIDDLENLSCPHCSGSGEVVLSIYRDVIYDKCPDCCGTGEKHD